MSEALIVSLIVAILAVLVFASLIWVDMDSRR